MTENQHIAKARDYLALAEDSSSEDRAKLKRIKAYIGVASEMAAAKAEGVSQRAFAEALGHGDRWATALKAWAEELAPEFQLSDADLLAHGLPFGGEAKDASRRKAEVKRALREAEPKQIQEFLAELPSSTLETIGQGANEAIIDRARARRAEHTEDDAEPTVSEIMGGESLPDFASDWADDWIIRMGEAARGFAALQKRTGLILGSMSEDEALGRLEEIEEIAAEGRVVLQERSKEAVL